MICVYPADCTDFSIRAAEMASEWGRRSGQASGMGQEAQNDQRQRQKKAPLPDFFAGGDAKRAVSTGEEKGG